MGFRASCCKLGDAYVVLRKKQLLMQVCAVIPIPEGGNPQKGGGVALGASGGANRRLLVRVACQPLP